MCWAAFCARLPSRGGTNSLEKKPRRKGKVSVKYTEPKARTISASSREHGGIKKKKKKKKT